VYQCLVDIVLSQQAVTNDRITAQVPKDTKVIVACQKGLRSLAACEQLSRAGFTDIAWVNGGFDNSQPGEVPTKESEDIRLAGIGGVSSILGWTQVQQETSGPAGGFKSVLLLVRFILRAHTQCPHTALSALCVALRCSAMRSASQSAVASQTLPNAYVSDRTCR
jgi:hypothetical protein